MEYTSCAFEGVQSSGSCVLFCVTWYVFLKSNKNENYERTWYIATNMDLKQILKIASQELILRKNIIKWPKTMPI